MARPTKMGLDYFPHDTHSNDDAALALIEAEFGAVGYAVYFKLLEFIYSQGYAAHWGDDECLLFYRKLGAIGVSANRASEIIKGLVRRSLFDKGVLDRFQILTSRSIQLRWLEAKRKSVEDIDPKVCLIEQTAKVTSSPLRKISSRKQGVFVGKTPVNSTKTPVFAESTPQSKVKESKVNNDIINNNTRESESNFAEARGQAPEWVRSAAAQHPALNLEQTDSAGEQKRSCDRTPEIPNIGATLRAGSYWKSEVCCLHKITEEQYNEFATTFEHHCKVNHKAHTSATDIQRHFNSWLSIQLEKQASQAPPKPQRYATATTHRPNPQDDEERKRQRSENIRRAHEQAIRNL